MTEKTYHRHRGRCRPSSDPWTQQPWTSPLAPRDESTSAVFDQIATSVGDAVGRIIRSLDPARAAEAMASMSAPAAPAERRRGYRACRCGCDCNCHDGYDDHWCDCCDCCASKCGPKCGPDPCHCECCIGDVDLVVYTRVGERRVVPITLENRRARERPVSLELGEFTSKGGSPSPVVGRLVTPTGITLAPCSDATVIIAVDVGTPGKPDKPSPVPGPGGGFADLTKAELVKIAREHRITGATSMTKDQLIEALIAATEEQGVEAEREPNDTGRQPIDVDDCHVAVADLCVQGCDHRPIRIAVAVLPRDCGPYEVACDCSCCC